MREFCRGWRRKVGLVTLAMVMLLMAGWMRSVVVWNRISVCSGQYTIHQFSSSGGRLGWERRENDVYSNLPLVFFDSDVNSSDLFAYEKHPSDNYFEWQFDSGGFVCCKVTDDEGFVPFTLVIMPYWSLVLPLTLLSAWLILGKTRKATGGTP